MSLARLKVRHRSSAQLLVFLFLALISFRMLYGVPPVSSDAQAAQTSQSVHDQSSTQVLLQSYGSEVQINDYIKNNGFDPSANSLNSNKSSESSNNKPLAPYKTFKNKIIKEKTFNPTDALDLHTIKFSHETPQLIAPSQGKRFLTTHSNAPPSQK